MEDSQYSARRFLSRTIRHKMPTVMESVVRVLDPRKWGTATGEVFGQKKDVWHRPLDNTVFGQFSLSMYEANYVMEDTVEVREGGRRAGGAVGVYEGRGQVDPHSYTGRSPFCMCVLPMAAVHARLSGGHLQLWSVHQCVNAFHSMCNHQRLVLWSGTPTPRPHTWIVIPLCLCRCSAPLGPCPMDRWRPRAAECTLAFTTATAAQRHPSSSKSTSTTTSRVSHALRPSPSNVVYGSF